MRLNSWRRVTRFGWGACAAVAWVTFAGAAPAYSAWSLVPSPSPGGSAPQLLAVSTESASDAWGVGVTFSTSTRSYKTVTEHWNGNAWAVTASPSPMLNQQLNGVAAISPSDAWAVGFMNNSQWASNRTLIVHWDGTSWTRVPSPNPTSGEDELWGVWASSASDVWAVGTYSTANGGANTFATHFNGSSWTVVPTPNAAPYNNLHRVFGSSSTDVWAVGTAYIGGEPAPVTLHWNGSSWKLVPSPDLGESYIRGGWASAATDAWIVGEWDGPAPNYTPHQLVYHWNGSSWKSVLSPSNAAYELYGVTARSPSDAWIAGVNSGSSNRRTLIEHWDGTSWTLVSSPNMNSTSSSDLYAIAMLPTGPAWAVGDWSGGTLTERNLQG